MDLKIERAASLKGRVRLPASKSFSIRAFMIAACGGRSKISFPSDCDDARVAMEAARRLGTRVTRLSGGVWTVTERERKIYPSRVHVKESGTVLRFILPLLSLSPRPCRITGEGTLNGRPNHHLVRLLRRQGVRIRGTGPKESVPIRMTGGLLRGGKMEIEGDVSSQFISALMIACPRLGTDTRIVIRGRHVVSADYIDMTDQVLKEAGVRIRRPSPRIVLVPGNQRFRGLKNFIVPSDYGLAAFLLAAGALVRSDLILEGHFRDDLVQADGRFLDFLKRMNVRIERTPKALRIRGPFDLKGGCFSMKDCPDLLPIMAVLSLFAKGKTRFTHVSHARVKESNRVSDLRRELLKTGAGVVERENELLIAPPGGGGDSTRQGLVLDSYHDHRLAMAWSILGLKCGARVRGIESVRKSYPGFVRDLKEIGASVHNRRLC